MALSAKVLTIDCPASTGNQAYTGVGFQPQALFFWYTTRTSNGNSPNAQIGVGVATSSSERFAWGTDADDNVGTTVVQRASSNAKCISLVTNDAGTTGLAADLVSMDADGFTLNWSIVTSGADIHVLALAGLSNAKAFAFSPTSGATGSQSFTGVGFQPQLILAMTAETTAVTADGGTASGSLSAHDGSNSGAIAFNNRDFQGSADGFVGFASNTFMPTVSATTSGYSGQATLTSFGADGFTINTSNAYDGTYLCNALCLRGLSVKVGSLTVPAGTGSQAISGLGFTPKAVLFFGAHHALVAPPSGYDDLDLFVGAASSSSSRAVASMSQTQSSDPIAADHDSDTTKCVKCLAAGTPTVDLAADLASLDADGFTLNWTTVGTGASSDEIIYVALGDEASAASSRRPQPIWVGL